MPSKSADGSLSAGSIYGNGNDPVTLTNETAEREATARALTFDLRPADWPISAYNGVSRVLVALVRSLKRNLRHTHVCTYVDGVERVLGFSKFRGESNVTFALLRTTRCVLEVCRDEIFALYSELVGNR